MITDLLHRLRALLRGRRWRDELAEEMTFHLEREEEARMRAGADPATARREARRAFGAVDRYREEARDAAGVRPMDELAADTRFALRALRRNPIFTATSIVVLALAIGAAAAVYTVVHAVLVAQLPYPHADRLVRVYQDFGNGKGTLSVVDYDAIRAQQRTLAAFGVARDGESALTGAGEPVQVRTVRVTSGFFEALGVKPAAGRLVEPGDEAVGVAPVVVVSHDFAVRRLGGVQAAVGRNITLDGVSHAVVGVLAAGVANLAGEQAELWPALQLPTPTRRGPFGLHAVARLKPGLTLAQAAQDLTGISRRIYPIWASSFKDREARFAPYPLRAALVGGTRAQLRLFALAVALVFLVAVANVATLMLVRVAGRRHELALRATLGASGFRLVRLILTEGMLLAGVGAALGLALAVLGLRLVGDIAPGLPRIWRIGLDGQTVLAAALLAVAGGLLVSLSPILVVLRGGLTASRAETRRSGGDRRTATTRGVLVACEFALAVPLLLGAALLANSFLRLQAVDPGFDAGHSFAVRLSLPASRYRDDASVVAFWRRAVRRATEVPGVVAAGLGTLRPPDSHGDVNNFNLVAHPVPPGGAEPVAPWSSVTPGYFQALGVPLLEGRLLTAADSGSAPPVVVVSRSWAAHYFPDRSPIGQQLVSGGCYACPLTTVVGVVGDVKYQGLSGNGDGVYEPLFQAAAPVATLFVRTRGKPAPMIRPVLDRIAALDPELPLVGMPTTELLRRTLADPGRWTAVLSAFAATALLLSALGIFGLLSYVVRRQRREIGVRLALGARSRDVARMIVTRGMRYVLTGTLAGLGLALLEGRWLRALLYGVTPRDPFTMAAVSAALLGIALVACLLPGLRAARIPPADALAQE